MENQQPTIWVKYVLSGKGAKDEDAKQEPLGQLLKQIEKGKFRNTPVYEWLGNQHMGLTNQFVRPYFDVDVDIDDKNRETIDFDSILTNAIEYITNQFTCSKDNLMISLAHRYDKYSCHLVIPSLKIQIKDLLRWHDEQKEQLRSLYIDPAVYREKGLMRMVGTSKLSLGAPLVHQNGNLEDHVISVLSGKEKECHLIFQTEVKKPKITTIRIKSKVNQLLAPQHEYVLAVDLCECLKNENLDWGDWNKVGLCLHNIDSRLIEQWITFSKLSTKYNEGETHKSWDSFGYDSQGLKMGTLKMWAKRDNPEKYKLIHRNELNTLLLKSQSQTTNDVAKVVDKMYHDDFVFCCKKGWYHYANHRWNTTFDGSALKSKLSDDVVAEYLRLMTYYSDLAKQCSEDEKSKKEGYLIIEKNLTDITYKLRDYTFKSKIIKECETLMLNSKFEAELNKNTFLLGFENGVYDLKKGEFRDGLPSDYLTFSVGYDFKEFKQDDPLIIEVFSYLKKTFPQKIVEGEKYDVCDAMLIIYSSILEGGNKHQHFYIQSNNGSNGKSQIVDLLDKTLGEYSRSVASNFFCDQVKKSASSASPELACLNGVRFIHSEEPDDDDILNVSSIKEKTGGSKITARPLYGETFEFIPQFKPFFSCNKKPSLKNVTPEQLSIWRRVKNLPFESTFVDCDQPINEEKFIFHKDNTLGEKIINWREPLMYILLEMYQVYKKEGITFLNIMKLADEEYKKQVDPLFEFFNDFIEETDEKNNKGLTIGIIWNSYVKEKAYLKKGILKKDVKKYIDSHKYPVKQGSLLGKHQKYLYYTLKWIDEKTPNCEIIDDE